MTSTNTVRIQDYFYGVFFLLSLYNMDGVRAIASIMILFFGIIITLLLQSNVLLTKKNYSRKMFKDVCIALSPFLGGIILTFLNKENAVGNENNFLMWFSLAYYSIYISVIDAPIQHTSHRVNRLMYSRVAVICMLVIFILFFNESHEINTSQLFTATNWIFDIFLVFVELIWNMCLLFVAIGYYFVGKNFVLIITRVLAS